jgi:uncharacterized protein YbjQ (UPF0145 family)
MFVVASMRRSGMSTKQIIFIGFSLLVATPVFAKNVRTQQSLEAGLGADWAVRTRGDLKVYFGAKHPPFAKKIQEISVKGNGSAGQTEGESSLGCHAALMSAIKRMQRLAQKLDGDAVVLIESQHGESTMKSSTAYYCGVGNARTEVKLTGTLVQLKR